MSKRVINGTVIVIEGEYVTKHIRKDAMWMMITGGTVGRFVKQVGTFWEDVNFKR